MTQPSSKRLRFAAPTSTTANVAELLGREEEAIGTIEYIPISRIQFDPHNPRRIELSREDPTSIAKDDPHLERNRAELEALQELANSIREHDVIQEIGVYLHGHDYRLIWGERRVRASILLGRETIKAKILPERPRNVRAKQLIENIIRRDLSLAERVEGLRQFLEERTNEGKLLDGPSGLQREIGFSQATAYAYWGVVNGPEDVRQAINAGTITGIATAYKIACINDPSDRQQALAALAAGESSDVLQPMMAQGRAVPAITRRGRPLTSVNLGKTSSGNVVRYIVERLLDKKEFTAYRGANWDDLKVAADILKQVLKKIEDNLRTPKDS
jgi:ParB/RepB/Spo0J family partition protein